MTDRFAVLGCCVDTPQFGQIRGVEGPSLIVVEKDGSISEVLRGTSLHSRMVELQKAGVEVRQLGDSEFLVPGFIDTHIHFPQFPYTGTGIDKPLMADDGFLKKYAFPTERSMSDVSQAKQVYSRALEHILSHGTTSAVIYGSAHLEASKALVDTAIELRGPRAFVGKVCMDRNCPDGYVETSESSLKETEEFIKYAQARARENSEPPFLAQPVVTPRFLPTCTPELLRGLGDLAAKYDCMIQSHMSESCDEIEFSACLFPGKSDAEAFEEFGLLRSPSLMGHCVHLMPGEEEILKRNRAAIAHCPLSNFFFAKEALPVKQLVKHGVKVGLGTDVAGGYSPSMLNAMRSAVLASKTLQFRRPPGCIFQKPSGEAPKAEDEDELRNMHDVTHFEALYLATQGGADAMGLKELLGSFEVGKVFDALVLGTGPTVMRFPGGAAESPEDVLQKIITLGDDRNIAEVYIGGVSVHRKLPENGTREQKRLRTR
mmetsp:Transcript_14397/g.25326  ORF Transcript_14397/g.25326 Transcript_14397/m.25326 type:complete len:487 (+) Transcript_14397:86-1546(+)|eukprot:CAMPEP_0197639188 /NCGR_PEP_ID=MMETSP1338-20131121/13880_1 /TAXON_ID=43686 ORGANISM="Pelagodinium beii, Strain RCC1491" /NCGR_SAMPLE_ID=MMETSP1338 /ASSEMBLY_ACC=CAM_ASM_000754 /LENGTH=486 /DNA_ID=CAMNT_0043211875 /DNA_START=69 /DNA_END=1529 /DNA_ORIENTATION=-